MAFEVTSKYPIVANIMPNWSVKFNYHFAAFGVIGKEVFTS